MRPPAYFKRIRRVASELWDQLERKPELAGPWHQLFRQVQSPRHVVSELLQNADDAGATEATVEINSGEFIFSHNGQDFDEEQFASLCRFGFSNKRTLHTIGFRGVGFKSTFSLGDEVRLVTPTLSVAFHKQRFTEPKWIGDARTTDDRTEVYVVIQDPLMLKELGKNLQEWGESPASLLFFHSIRSLRVHEKEIRWEAQGTGPVEDSEWMSISTTPEKQYLILRSSSEGFPEDALKEIRDERMTPDDGTTFPPCRVEIVLGMEGRLFVVLPTGVITQLPFACNAPFIQDPARMKIKDPALSRTNAWLLRRVGELAADAMQAWVRQRPLPIEERCQAYGLLPDVDRDDNSIEGSCGSIVEEGFKARTEGREFLLTDAKRLESAGKCLAVPSELLDVWSQSQVSAMFSTDSLSILSRYVTERDRSKLINWGHIKTLDKPQVLEALKNHRLPRPRSWRQLLHLWHYMSPDVIRPWPNNRDVQIVPAQGKEVLYAVNEVVRLGERRTINPTDWDFLAPYFSELDPNWTRFLTQEGRNAQRNGDQALEEQVQTASRCLSALGLAEPTSADRFINRVVESFFSQGPTYKIRDCVRLAHIAAKLGAAVPSNFKWVTQAAQVRGTGSRLTLADIDGDLDMFVDDDWYKNNVLHDAYAKPSETCTYAEWAQWVRSPRSRLHTFVPLAQTRVRITGRERLRATLRQRGFEGEPYFHYKYGNFRMEDWDFDSTHWGHWNSLARNDDKFWSDLLTRILEQPRQYWAEAITARAVQEATTGNTRTVTQEPLVPEWIMRFRGLPCLPNTWGQPHQPAELFRRTPETEPLRDVEQFVKAELDTEATRPLLVLLGVRDKPTGPERLLERLRALAGSNTPLLPEVQKWCHSLDLLFDRCSTDEIQEIKAAFATDRLILTEQDGWAGTEDVYLNPDRDGVPGAVLIHPSLRGLTLWRKIGVTERPTADQAIEWLKGFRSGQRLTARDARRVRSLLPSYSSRIWGDCGHWLSLEGEWVSVDKLAYSLTMQSLVPWNHLFPGVKSRTADFQSLSSETCQSYPFSALRTLGDVIEERFQGQSGLPNAQEKPWLVALGNGLRRIVLDDDNQTERVRGLAYRLSQTWWQVAEGLESVPYIDGTPIGTSRPIDVLWRADLLYVQKGSPAKMARVVPQEIARAFNRQEITDAIKLCYERPSEFINEYLDESFNLVPMEDVELDQPIGEPIIGDEESIIGPVPPSIRDGADTGDTDASESTVTDEGVDEESPVREGENETSSTGTRRQPRQPQPSVIERFAQAHGFFMNGTGKFYHENGSWLERTRGNAFPWELRSASGELVRYYWYKEHCIQREPLQLEAAIWDLCQQYPDLYSLVLTDVKGSPIEIAGSLLVQMREQEELILHPASYRLVYRGEDGRQL